jgi:phospholipid transport system substrate-binding protein
MKRRSFISTAIAGFGMLPFMSGAAAALTEARAKSLVDTLVNDINKVIASGKS